MKGNLTLCLVLLLLMATLPLLALSGKKESSPPAQSGSQAEISSPAPKPSSDKTEGNKDSFTILDTSTKNVITVNGRDFLYGAICAEMSPENQAEALKAQGVAAYTYYGRLRQQQKDKPDDSLGGADFEANLKIGEKYAPPELLKERWGEKYQTYYDKLTPIVDDIYGKALTSGGTLACSTFYAISGGQTESSEEIWGGKNDYLVPVASPGDAYAAGYQTIVTAAQEDARQAILKKAADADLSGDPKDWFGKLERTKSGSVTKAVVGGKEINGADLRDAFLLRSQNFTVEFQDASFTFTVRGYGHGVGMSQVGAQYMAAQGSTYQQILSWYYPNTSLETVV